MKKFIEKIKKNLRNNQGSGLVLVIVALAFIGILMGALLTASMAVYKLKLYDYNAKDNFYYVEQAMDEIYAGVGSKTVSNLQKAYSDTLESLIYYQPDKKTYLVKDNDEANEYFKNQFMTYMIGDDTFKNDLDSIKKMLSSFISNPTVKLTNVGIGYYDVDGNSQPDPKNKKIGKIVLKSVTLQRTVEYSRSQASGTFTQTIATDIVIARPKYDINFSDSKRSTTDLFDFCMIADSGVEFNETPGNMISVAGDVYAASDFYNKRYNHYSGSRRVSADTYNESNITGYVSELSFEIPVENKETGDASEEKQEYKITMNPVSKNAFNGTETSLYNHNDRLRNGTLREDALYDGKNQRSMYSGFYIDNNKVNVIAGKLIVPGTIAVMNTGELSVYGNGKGTTGSGALASIWADNMVLGGYVNSATKKSSSALLNANVFMKDDTSIESEGATYKLVGSYYGYSDSRTADVREFVPTVAKDSEGVAIYQEIGNDGKTVYSKGHYNSSAFIVNGQSATIDFSKARNIFLAGRSYIELSRQKTYAKTEEVEQKVGDEDVKYNVTSEQYQYDTDIKDYKTGESLSVSSGQFAYLPFNAPRAIYKDGTAEIDHYVSDLPGELTPTRLFVKYFGATNGQIPEDGAAVMQVPVTYQRKEVTMANGTKRTKSYYYLDFEYAAEHKMYDSSWPEFDAVLNGADGRNMADVLKTAFIRDYYYYLNFYEGILKSEISIAYKPNDDGSLSQVGTITYKGQTFDNVDGMIFDDDDLAEVLTQITDDTGFKAGQITLPKSKVMSSVYASGTVATTIEDDEKNVTYSVITDDRVLDSTLFLTDEDRSNEKTTKAVKSSGSYGVADYSDQYAKHYNYVKFTLGDIPENDPAAVFIDNDIIGSGVGSTIYGEASITPINYYLRMEEIPDEYYVDRTLEGGYKIIATSDDVHLKLDEADDVNEMTGIIVSKGDVYIDNQPVTSTTTGTVTKTTSKSVNKFNGIIICGGKLYVNGNVESISASNTLCKKILTECANLSKSGTAAEKKDADIMLKLFKGYEGFVTKAGEGDSEETNTKSGKSEITTLDYSDIVTYENWMKSVD